MSSQKKKIVIDPITIVGLTAINKPITAETDGWMILKPTFYQVRL